MLPSVANGEVAEHISDELPLCGGRARPPDPLIESAPPVGAPCAKQPPVCFCFVRWHFTSGVRCRLPPNDTVHPRRADGNRICGRAQPALGDMTGSAIQ